MNFLFIIILVVCAKNLFLWLMQGKYNIHMIQLCSYNLDQTFLWYKKNWKSFILNVISFVIDIVVIGYLYYKDVVVGYKKNESINMDFVFMLIFIVVFLSIIIFVNLYKKRKAKKELAITDRVKRNFVAYVLLTIFLIVIGIIIYNVINSNYQVSDDNWAFNGLHLLVFDIIYICIFSNIIMSLSPIIMLVSFLFMNPIETNIKKEFMKKASDKLKNSIFTKVVGITGSFGKTSVKNFLYSILSIKYNVCKTPASYNTPMGLTLTINNNLKNYDDILIAEMGARRIGDIKEICDMVQPVSAIITSVGEMHLDTFKNIENVMKTKMELVDSVIDNVKKDFENDNKKCDGKINDNEDLKKQDVDDWKNNMQGLIVLNGDNFYIRKYMEEKYNYRKLEKVDFDKDKVEDSFIGDDSINKNIKVLYVGENENNDVVIKNIRGDLEGTKFDLIFKNNNYTFETKLVGKNNIFDLALAIVYGVNIGIDIKDIFYQVRKIEQVKNRLEFIKIDNENILINDAYNSNPVGAKSAVETLEIYDGWQKVIITPGMVELGDMQYEENKKFGALAGEKLDYVLIVGKTNKEALIEGAKEGFDRKVCVEKNDVNEKVLYFDKEEEAIIYSRNNIIGKKVVLLENDLTDNY